MTARHATSLVLLAWTAATPALAQAVGPSGPIAASCGSCHLPDRAAAPAIPSIAGLNEGQIVRMMMAFRAAGPEQQIMHVVAKALSVEEIAAVAHELADRPAVAASR